MGDAEPGSSRILARWEEEGEEPTAVAGFAAIFYFLSTLSSQVFDEDAATPPGEEILVILGSAAAGTIWLVGAEYPGGLFEDRASIIAAAIERVGATPKQFGRATFLTCLAEASTAFTHYAQRPSSGLHDPFRIESVRDSLLTVVGNAAVAI